MVVSKDVVNRHLIKTRFVENGDWRQSNQVTANGWFLTQIIKWVYCCWIIQ